MNPAAPRSSVPMSTRAAVTGASAILFLIALFLPALEFHGVNGVYVNGSAASNLPGFDQTLDLWSGGKTLFNGLLGILDGQLAGYANPFLWIAWIFLLTDRIRTATIFAAIAAALSSLTFLLFQSPIPEDEGGVKHALLTHLHSGAWLWFAAIAIPLIAGILWWGRQLPPVLRQTYMPPPPPVQPAPPPNPNLRY